jgi:uncharacterized protein (DUF1684 family)
MAGDYGDQLRRQRERKEEYFGTHDHSPIPPDAQGESFPGLDFFEPDPEYRFVLQLFEHDDPESITVETSADGQQEYLRWGEFRFELDGEQHTLQVYRSDRDDERLWVPFRDETSGDETYGAGRYLDLEPDSHRTDDGRWVLDFNLAYNPTCAYSEAYECPLVPADNWLDARIEAGEKAYPGEPATVHHHH